MSTAETQITLESDFFTRWNGETPIAFNNVYFDSEGVEEWTLFDVNFATVNQMSLGSDACQQRQKGFINIQFYTKLKNGSQRTLELIDLATGLLSGVRVDNVLIYPPEVNIAGETAKWYVSDMDFNFEYDFVRT